jgi:hypothetical protein
MRQWWKTIFIGAQTVVLVLLVVLMGVKVRDKYPAFFAGTLIVSFGVVLGGVKAILEVTKLAGEVAKLASELSSRDLEITKLKLEIEEKQRAKAKDEARVVVPTGEQIRMYTTSPAYSVAYRSRPGLVAKAGLVLALALVLAGLVMAYHAVFPPSLPMPRFVPKQTQISFICNGGSLAVYPDRRIVYSARFDTTLRILGDVPLGSDHNSENAGQVSSSRTAPRADGSLRESPPETHARIEFWAPADEIVLPLEGPTTNAAGVSSVGC